MAWIMPRNLLKSLPLPNDSFTTGSVVCRHAKYYPPFVIFSISECENAVFHVRNKTMREKQAMNECEIAPLLVERKFKDAFAVR
jgi:hypothetical protein